MSTPVVSVRNVHKQFGGVEVLRGVDFEVHAGEVVCLMGPSGSGKTTLIRCINHLEVADQGEIQVEGRLMGYREHKGVLVELPEREVAAQRSHIGMVFQRFNLFPHLTVLDNVLAPAVLARREPRTAYLERAIELLGSMGLESKRDSYPSELSGGQQQRAAIARAILMDPALVLFDEPTSALDPELVGDVLDAIRGLASRGLTMIVVTHEVQFARDVADRVVFMADGQVDCVGSPASVIDDPPTARSQAFFQNSSNYLRKARK